MNKNFLFFLLFTFPFLLSAQAPQGLNYQAVVFGSNGAPLGNHAISLQLSVLDSTATGNAVYVETQNATTDTTGLFSVVIGNGTIVSGTFPSINWGKNFKFLKTEIDTAAGNNFVLMGVTQFMSVPYALYSEKTKDNFTSTEYPDGTIGATPVFITGTLYTVPAGKNLYVPYTTNASAVLNNDTTTFAGIAGVNVRSTIGVGAGETIFLLNGETLQGFLVNKKVDWLNTDVVSNPITVPTGKIFTIMYSSWSIVSGNVTGFTMMINGTPVSQTATPDLNSYILLPGQTLSATVAGGGIAKLSINGYFRDN